jgi:Ca2+-binding RTX toxin-like protein
LTGTAINGTDYNNRTGIATFGVGSSTTQVTILPKNDNVYEGNETAILTLTPGGAYTLDSPNTATVTLTDNDPLPLLNLSANRRILEGLTSPRSIAYTVSLSTPSSQTITVNYATADGTALAGSDYIQQAGTLTFSPGTTSQVITLSILNDALNEADETFDLNLSNPSLGTLGTAKTITTITDTLNASETTTLPARIENLTLIGMTAINGTGNNAKNLLRGNSGNNILTGLAGNDTLDGGAGMDTLIGGLGNDFYQVDSTTDTITELLAEGIDTIQSSVNFSLEAIANVENVVLTGANPITATGNILNNRLTGNLAANSLAGGAGIDILRGEGGNDTLVGGGDGDTLIGGVGQDSLTGGTGGDRFTFNFRNEGMDQLTDFVSAQGDKIAVSAAGFGGGLGAGIALTPAQFALGTAAVNTTTRFIYNPTNGRLLYDSDGAGVLMPNLLATLGSKPALTFTDFVVIA